MASLRVPWRIGREPVSRYDVKSRVKSSHGRVEKGISATFSGLVCLGQLGAGGRFFRGAPLFAWRWRSNKAPKDTNQNAPTLCD